MAVLFPSFTFYPAFTLTSTNLKIGTVDTRICSLARPYRNLVLIATNLQASFISFPFNLISKNVICHLPVFKMPENPVYQMDSNYPYCQSHLM